MTGYIRVLLAATFREIVGQREILKEVGSGITLGEVLTTLVERYARDFSASAHGLLTLLFLLGLFRTTGILLSLFLLSATTQTAHLL